MGYQASKSCFVDERLGSAGRELTSHSDSHVTARLQPMVLLPVATLELRLGNCPPDVQDERETNAQHEQGNVYNGAAHVYSQVG